MTLSASARTRLLAVLTLAVLPWTVVYTRGFVTVITSVALVDPRSRHVTTVFEYLTHTMGAPPDLMVPWVVGTLLFALVVISAALAFVGREDDRVTAFLLVLLGVTQLSVAVGFAGRPTYVAVPVVTVAAWALAWVAYRPALARLVS
jgi:uncharacterized protein (TIGR04206 family)